jgi:glycosyltransferase involved in cell wall biosynthesis
MSKKLLFIIPLFPKSKEDDTIVPFIYQFSTYFSKKYKDVKIDILTLNYPFKRSVYTIDNITIYAIGGNFKKGLHPIFRFFRSIKFALYLYKKNNYDGILSFWYGQTAIIGKILANFYKKKHFTWLQGQDVKTSNKFLKFARPKAESLICVGKNHQQLLFKNHNLLSPNIANVAINSKNFPNLNHTTRMYDIIGVGNLGPLKNYGRFIDVVFELKKTNPNLKVIICGDGEEKKELQEKIERLKLKNTIQLLGYQKNADVINLLNNSKLLLHTSNFEGNPMVIQEALYSGCNVVSTFNITSKEEVVSNYYYSEKNLEIISKISKILNSENVNTQRVHLFKIDDTVATIYNLFY